MKACNDVVLEGRVTAPLWWMASMVGDWCVIAGSAYAAMQAFRLGQADPTPLTLAACGLVFLAAWILMGARQHALAILGHDGAHGLVCRSLPVNDFLVRVFAFVPLGVALTGYRFFHFAHHQWLATPRDPELQLKQRVAERYALPQTRARMALRFLGDLCGGGLGESLDLVMLILREAKAVELLQTALWWGLVGGGLYLLEPQYALFLAGGWFFCLGTSFWALFRLRIYTEHLGTHETHVISAALWERTLFLPHNAWCHFEHHSHSHVSVSKLPCLRRLETLASHRPVTVGSLFEAYAQPLEAGDICLTRIGG